MEMKTNVLTIKYHHITIRLSCIVLLLKLWVNLINTEIIRTDTHKQATFMKVYDDKILSVSSYERHYVNQTVECARHCIRNLACKSFNIWVDVLPIGCDLLFIDRFDSINFASVPGTKYYDAAPIYPNCKLAAGSNGNKAGLYFIQDVESILPYNVYCTANGSRVYSNCKDTLLNHENLQGEYIIQPDQNYEPFPVTCRKDGDDYITEVSHDWEVKHISGREDCPGLQMAINYNGVSDLSPLTKLVDASEDCSQSASAQCVYADLLLYHGRTENCIGAADRHLNHIGFWAGGNPNKYCACGVEGTCVDSSLECNCEYAYSRVDEGTYTNKSLLPLGGIYAGDTGSSFEYLNFKIGKLICWQK